MEIEQNREIYKHGKRLVWEFQAFNKLFKVDKYVYFLKELPELKNNRIWVTAESLDFLQKVVVYYEQRKGITEESNDTKKSDEPKQTQEKKETGEVKKYPTKENQPIEPPEKNVSVPQKTLEVSRPKVEIPSTKKLTKQSAKKESPQVDENNVNDFYQDDRSYKIDYVFIDPGHGGRDPGATFYGYVEKDLTLSLSKELAAILNKENPDFKVVLTRKDDRYLSLEQRCAIANQTLKPNENGIFISVHLNVWVNPDARGIEVFYLTGNDKVIQRKTYRHLEDLAGAQQGYFKKIFSYFKVIQYQMESRFLSYQIIKNIESNVKASIPRGYKNETFFVLKGVLMPAVLLELGFISNRQDMELINNRDKRKEILKQVSIAIIQYTDDFKKSNGFRDDFYFNKFLSLE